MSIIEQIHKDHADLARVLKKHTGIREIVEDLYPDTAHFIYELLQNAEDAGASEVAFVLSESALAFEHNGRPFNEADIRGITDIGEGTKSEDEDQIGRFGIGFKAVFAYTESPFIWSPTYCFKISEMVLPSEIPSKPGLNGRTRFEFPFNSSKKPQIQAYSEVCDGLVEISDNTLLFLSNVEEIQWRVDGGGQGRLLRILHPNHRIEILREIDGRPTESSHFLRFGETVDGLEHQHVAVAFVLNSRSETRQTDALDATLTKQFRVVPADRGCVAVYFTAAKETSNLRFHLHAPFVPELSRSSIKNTPANEPHFKQIARLVAKSLIVIRDLGLLDREFLSVLPNSQDEIPERYTIIQDAIVDAMNELPLTPTHVNDHAPACQLLQAEAGLKDLLNRDDISFLVDSDNDRRDWAIAATQRNNRIDRFLRGLDIEQWGVEEFMETLEYRCSNTTRFCVSTYTWEQSLDQTFLDWMRQKPVEWHRALYTFFNKEMEDELHRFKKICVVRRSDDEFGTGPDCYFPTPETREDPIHPRVAEYTYTGSGTKTEQRHARAFLEGIGVREVGEFEQIEAILKRRYTKPDKPPPWKNYKSDLTRFIGLVEKDRGAAGLFKDYFIFQRADNRWSRPSGLYLDSPYLDTGLEAYYSRHGSGAKRDALSSSYRTFDKLKQLVDFARMCGVADRLEIAPISCDYNPNAEYLQNAPGTIFTDTGINRDFYIPKLEALFKNPSLELSRLVWKTFCERSNDMSILKATYQYNQSNLPHYADSHLVYQLRNTAWIPQRNDQFVLPSEAVRDLLPDDFPFAPDWSWLEAINFGTKTKKPDEIQKIAVQLGFRDEAALTDAKRFADLAPHIRQKILMDHGTPIELPVHKPKNPTRRAEKVRKNAQKAPKRESEIRQRSVSKNRDNIKSEKTVTYLLEHYTNADGVTICQACHDSLPFQLPDGSYYFEAVEFLPDLKKHHHQNYIALCPNHAAMFKHANNSKDETESRFLALDGNELELELAHQTVTIYFTELHLADLRVVIDVENAK